MLLFPLVMNVVQAWLIDMVIKAKAEQHIAEYDAVEVGEDTNEFVDKFQAVNGHVKSPKKKLKGFEKLEGGDLSDQNSSAKQH